MSLKKLFKNKAETGLNKAPSQQINVSSSFDVESFDALKQKADFDKKIFAFVDISASLSNYVRYGLAEEHFDTSIKRIYQDYPYDGTQAEKYKFLNDSNTFDYYIWKDKYPKTTGYITLNEGTSVTQRVEVKAGPNLNNVYRTGSNQANNLYFDADEGVTIEFWAKPTGSQFTGGMFETVDSSGNYFVVWFNSPDGDAAQLAVQKSSSAGGIEASTTFTSLAGKADNWHHYALTFEKNDDDQLVSTLYVDGDYTEQLTDTARTVSTAVNAVSGNVGFAQTYYFTGSVDEFRYWKTKRTTREIGLNWNTHVDGGSNKKGETGRDLSLYLKFNEGITTFDSTDASVLDYSGRVASGSIINYETGMRSINSAIKEYDSEYYEVPDPIIYSFHPDVSALIDAGEIDGKAHDNLNNHSFYQLMPSWIRDQDNNELRYLSHIIGAYFDELYAQISSFEKVKDKNYQAQDLKIFPYYKEILESHGFDTDNFLVGNDILAELNEKTLVGNLASGSISDLKNKIYRNIYNNLLHLYKSKGTQDSIRNLLNCYGVNQNMFRMRNYSNFTTSDISNREQLDVFEDKSIDFYGLKNFISGDPAPNESSIFNFTSSDSKNQSFVSSLGDAFTVESNVYFPRQASSNSDFYVGYDVSGSIFGVHAANSGTVGDASWYGDDVVGLAAYTVHSGKTDRHAKFILSSTNGKFTDVESDVYEVFDNTNWNLAIVVQPEGDARNLPASTSKEYVARLIGYQVDSGQTINSFNITASIGAATGTLIVAEAKRVFVGAERTNNTGSVVYRSQARIGNCKFYADSLEEEEVFLHAKYKNSEGRLRPFENANRKNDNDTEFVPQYLTKIFEWDFEQVTKANGSGQFEVQDTTSASLNFTGAFSGYGNASSKLYNGFGFSFPANVNAYEKEFVSKYLNTMPDESTAANVVNSQGESEIIFQPNEAPPRDAVLLAKSMYEVISSDILRSFAGVADFNYLIGNPVNKYRLNYKDMEGLRRLYFESVENNPTLEKFVNYFGWLDGVIESIIENMLPATTNLVSDATNVVESHVLERSKYPLKYPTLEFKPFRPTASIGNIVNLQNIAVRTSLLTDRRPGAVGSFNFASSSAKTPNYVNVVEIGAKIIPSGNIEPVVIQNRAYATSTTDDRVDAVTSRNYATSTIGNYREAYEAVHTVGQKGAINGKYLAEEKGLSEAGSVYVSGVFDYPTPNRTKYKTVIRSIFNAPGDPDTAGAGLDTAAREMSPYNSLNYRNLGVRVPLNNLYKIPSAFGGYQSGSTSTASYHKVPRNGYTRKEFDGSSIVDKKVFDNAFVQTQIPASDLGYAWIANSYQSADIQRYQTSSQYAPNEQITFLSASDLVTFQWNDGRRYAFATKARTDTDQFAGNAQSGSEIPVDFVGLNLIVYEPLTTSPNTVGWDEFTLTKVSGGPFDGYFIAPGTYLNLEDSPSTTPPSVKIDYVEPYKRTPGVDNYFGPEAVLHAILLHRNGPYGYPAWKAYRKDAHPIVREQRSENVYSYITGGIISTRFGTLVLNGFNHVTQSPVSTTEPIFIQLEGTSFDIKAPYENQKLGFTNENLQVYKSSFEKGLDNKTTFLDKVINEEDLQIAKLTLRSNVYPKTEHQFLNKTRTRDLFDNQWWRSARGDRDDGNPTSSYGIFGYPMALPSDTYGTASVSRWSMDAVTDFGSSRPDGVLDAGGTALGPANPFGQGELQNPITKFHFFRDSTVAQSGQSSPTYYRRDIEFITASAPNMIFAHGLQYSVTGGVLNTGEALWEVGSQSGREPFYNSYEDYAKELRLQGKDYSIVPEFRMDDHIDAYLREGFDFKRQLANFFSLTGTSATNIAQRYSAAELSDVLGTVQEDTGLGVKRFGLKAKAYLKLLPYEGFYPQQRTLQLAAELYETYVTSGAVEHRLFRPPDGAGPPRGASTSRLSHVLNNQHFLDSYVSPGILYNTIKSGLAVDYPLYKINRYDAFNSNLITVATYTIASGAFNGLFIGDFINKMILDQTASSFSLYEDRLNAMQYTRAGSGSYPWLNKFMGINYLFDGSEGFGQVGTVQRIPFEAILEPRKHFDGIYEQCDPNLLIRDTASFSINARVPRINYELKSNNFFAETVNFFLKRGLTSYESDARDKFSFDVSKEYSMDFVITNANYASVNEYTDQIIADNTLFTGSAPIVHVFMSGSQETIASAGTNNAAHVTASANCVMYDRPSAFGFPSMEVYFTGALDAQLHTQNFANFTPPYYHGFARARYQFQPAKNEYTMDELVSSLTMSYFRANDNPFRVLLNSTNYPSASGYSVIGNNDHMQLSSSFVLDAVVETKKTTFGTDGGSRQVENFDTSRKKLVIHSKYECPVLNFKDVDRTISNYGLSDGIASKNNTGVTPTTCPKGMWHQYGKIPDSRDGIFTQVVDTPFAELSDAALTSSLARALGMERDKKAIGQLATSREIEEALVVLPYYIDSENQDEKQQFFDFNPNLLSTILDKANDPSIKTEDDQIIRQIRLMKKYVFPPFLDFVTFPDEKNVKKSLMYIFEFGRTLSQQDLANIWQGVLPDAGLNTVYRESVIDLDTNYANFPPETAKGQSAVNPAQAIVGNIQTLLASEKSAVLAKSNKTLDDINFLNLDFFVFKVKKRAEYEYSKITKNTTDDKFKFDFKATGFKSKQPFFRDFGEDRLAYSYNYPYDFFSLIELAKVDAQIELEGDEE
jgi:hypothetical protein